MKSKLVLLVWLFVLLAGVASAEGNSEDTRPVFDRYPNALGAYGIVNFETSTSLGGLTWQRWFDRIGVQVAGGGLVNNGNNFNYNVYGTFQYRLYAADFARWFSAALYTNVLLGHSANGLAGLTYYPAAHLGLGIGIETVFLEHLAPSLEFMYLASLPLEVGFAAGFSLRYRY